MIFRSSKNIKFIFQSILILMFFSSCSGTKQFINKIGDSTSPSTITIIRGENNTGGGLPIPIYDDTTYIGELGSENSITWKRPSGKIELNITVKSSPFDDGFSHQIAKGLVEPSTEYELTIGYGYDIRKSGLECLSMNENISCQYPITDKSKQAIMESEEDSLIINKLRSHPNTNFIFENDLSNKNETPKGEACSFFYTGATLMVLGTSGTAIILSNSDTSSDSSKTVGLFGVMATFSGLIMTLIALPFCFD